MFFIGYDLKIVPKAFDMYFSSLLTLVSLHIFYLHHSYSARQIDLVKIMNSKMLMHNIMLQWLVPLLELNILMSVFLEVFLDFKKCRTSIKYRKVSISTHPWIVPALGYFWRFLEFFCQFTKWIYPHLEFSPHLLALKKNSTCGY